MKVIKLLLQIGGLYLIFLIGSIFQQLIHIPIPGSIIGMLLLFILLLTGVIKKSWIELGSNFLLSYLPLILLPSVIGVMNYGNFFVHKGIILAVLILINTILIIACSSLLSQWLANQQKKKAIRGKQS